ncbi:MAG: LuxR C-terminal-related transcriptional regulator [Acidimicrobiales bacterium]
MRSAGLPLPPTRFIGLVTILGPAGVGKTRLAVEIAQRHAPDTDDVVFVPLADLDDPGRFPAALLASLGGADVSSRSPLALAVDHLADRTVLLVLDNFEHLVAAAPDVARLIETAPRVRVLVTSRRPLGVRAEHCVPLRPLTVPDATLIGVEESIGFDAVALFVARLEAADARYRLTAGDVADIVRICRRLDGLPLALELAAARARSLPLGAIADAIEARIDVLGPASPDLPSRHRTMPAAVSWSVDLLSAGAAALFRELGVYAGATVHAIGATGPDLGLDHVGVFGALDELVAHSLVVKDPNGRFRMLEVVRDVALDQLEAAGTMMEARDRHVRWFCAFAQETAAGLSGEEQRESLDQLQAEASNLSAAVRHALRRHDAATALRLCLALRMLWYVRGPIAEGRALFEQALSSDGAPAPLRTAAMIEAAALARHHGDLETADALTDGAVAHARKSDDEPLLAASLLQRGFVLHLAGRYGEARPVLEESLALSHRRDDRLAVGRASHHLGFVASFGDGDLALAWELQCRCLALFRDLHHERHVLTALIAMTEVARARGDLRAARGLASEANGHLRSLRDTPLLVHALHHVAALTADEGHPTQALRLLGAAEGLEAASGSTPWPAVAAGARRWLPSAERSVGHGRADALRAEGRRLGTEEALAMLDSAGGDRDGAGLSRREQQVATLVAEGLTNRAIAERLFVSERTVDGHVARALSKLGLHNRTQLAAHVARRDV